MKVLYTRYNNSRGRAYATATKIVERDGRRSVVKEAVYPAGRPHILQLAQNVVLLREAYGSSARVCGCEIQGDAAVFEYVDGPRLTEQLRAAVRAGRETLRAALADYIALLEMGAGNACAFARTAAFDAWFGGAAVADGVPALRLANMDATPDNVILQEGAPVVVDYEWVFDFPVPRDFVRYRNLFVLYYMNDTGVQDALAFDELCALCGITLPIALLEQMDRAMNAHIAGKGEQPPAMLMAAYLKPETDIRTRRVQAEEPALPETARHRLRRLLSRLRQNGQVEELRSVEQGRITEEQVSWQGETGTRPLVYCVERFAVADCTLTVRGWAAAGRNVSAMGVLVETDSHRAEVAIEGGLKREDVVQALGRESALNSGFRGSFSVQAGSRARAYLVLHSGDAVTKLYLGEIPATGGVAAGKLECGGCESADSTAYGPFILEKGVTGHMPDGLKNPVDVVVPVYNGYEYLETLFRGIRRTQADFNLIIIDDCSTDERVLPLLLEQERQGAQLVRNKRNMGFVASVNRGLKQTRHNVAIVNTDVELPQNWLERLVKPLEEDVRVASATPFTNAGTLMSFPQIGVDNEPACGLDVDGLDAAFRDLLSAYTPLPTGVGFCMAMSRRALDATGLLDARAFRRGYGEENDWCLRAARAGYRNVAVENLFVLHKHGGSFTSAEKTALMERNLKTLRRRHPGYEADVAAFFQEDPLQHVRALAFARLLSAAGAARLVFSHGLGGGAAAYIEREIGIWKQTTPVVLVAYDAEHGYYTARYLYQAHDLRFLLHKLQGLDQLLAITGVADITVNELASYPEILQTVAYILRLGQVYNAPIRVMLHDYFSLCPSLNLLDSEGGYCGVPADAARCAACLTVYGYTRAHGISGVEAWREAWRPLLQSAAEVTVFSQSSADILERAYGKLDNVVVRPHRVDYLRPVQPKPPGETLTIGLLGVLDGHKGIGIVRQMLETIRAEGAPARIVLVGNVSGPLEDANFTETGTYEKSDLPALTEAHGIDVFLIPSIWPETFSFTTEEAMAMGLPVACFDIGAPAERVGRYGKGILIEQIDGSAALHTLLDWVQGQRGE